MPVVIQTPADEIRLEILRAAAEIYHDEPQSVARYKLTTAEQAVFGFTEYQGFILEAAERLQNDLREMLFRNTGAYNTCLSKDDAKRIIRALFGSVAAFKRSPNIDDFTQAVGLMPATGTLWKLRKAVVAANRSHPRWHEPAEPYEAIPF